MPIAATTRSAAGSRRGTFVALWSHVLQEGPLLGEDEALLLREGEVLAAGGIGFEARAIRLVVGEAGERDQSPRDVVGPFVRQVVAHEVAAAAGDDLEPAPGVRLEG